MLTLAALELESLAEAMIGSLVAGVGVVFAFAFGMLALIRASDLRDDGRPMVAAFAATAGVVGLATAVAATAVGLSIIAGDGPLL
jgi:hypothetical protein